MKVVRWLGQGHRSGPRVHFPPVTPGPVPPHLSTDPWGSSVPAGPLLGDPQGKGCFPVTHRDDGHCCVDHGNTGCYILGVRGLQARGHLDHVCVVVDLNKGAGAVRRDPKARPLAYLSLLDNSPESLGHPLDRKEAVRAEGGWVGCDLDSGGLG